MRESKKKRSEKVAEIPPSVLIYSLGCVKNFVDSEIAAASLLTAGFSLTPDAEEASVIFINSCAFLASAREELEEILQSAKRWKKQDPVRKIIVGGCVVPWDTDNAFRTAHPEVDAWCEIHSVEEIGAITAAAWNGDAIPDQHTDQPYIHSCRTPRLQMTPQHYAYLKVSDGCDNRCTYCKIPDIRGTLRSRTVADVLQEARDLLSSGVKELIVIAQDTAAFGRDLYGSPRLTELLKELDQLDDLAPEGYLVRLMYLHPASVDDELMDTMNSCKHLVRCIEMPLQHISDRILKAMHRREGGARTREVVRRLNQDFGFAIRTTFMVGFPGETKEDFDELLSYVKEAKFARLGTFIYSREAGVPAAEMADQVPAAEAKKRLKKLMTAQAAISLAANEALIGTEVNVIIDELLPRGKALGRMFADAPEIDNSVLISGVRKEQYRCGDFVKVVITAADEYDIQGTIAERSKAR